MNRGTNERKRAAKAAPPPRMAGWSPGCLAVLCLYVVVCLVFLLRADRPIYLALAVPGPIVGGYLLTRYVYGLGLLVAVRIKWSPRGVRCLLVHSDSPIWDAHVRTNWLPRFGHAAILLNWSEREAWRASLAVRVFRHFCSTDRNFNPAVVVFQGLRRPLVFRFFYAFQEANHGRPQYLEGLESQLMEVLDARR